MPLNFALKSQAEKGIKHQFTTETVRTCSFVTNALRQRVPCPCMGPWTRVRERILS